MTPEGKVVAAIRSTVRNAGGLVRKVEWSGVRGAPDLFVMLGGRHCFVEVKAPGNRPDPHQTREHLRMARVGGCEIYVIDSEPLAKLLPMLMEQGGSVPLKAANNGEY